MTKALRPYQNQAIAQVITKWETGLQRLIYVLSTGGGKSFTAFSLIKYLAEDLNKYVVLVVKKRNLVFQLEEDAIAFNLDYSLVMAGEVSTNAKVQICSIDTLHSRKDYPHADKKNVVLVIDECDESNNDSYHNLRDAYPGAKELGLTATPYNGLPFYDGYVQTISAKELIRDKVLTPARYIVPEKKLDTSEIKLNNGEFSSEQVDSATVIGDVVDNWFQYGEGRHTLVFSNSIKKSKELVSKFRARGITAVHCDKDTTELERRAAIASFKSGKIKILSNVRLFTRGTNIIEVGCMINAAPTTKLNLYLQKIGRGVRANPLYKDLIFIDHASDCLSHGEFDEEREVDLAEGIKFTRAEMSLKMSNCSKCFRAYPASKVCPFCGYVEPPKPIKTKNAEGKLVEMTPEDFAKMKMIKFYKKEMWVFMNYKIGDRFPERRGEVHVKLIEEFTLLEVLKVKTEVKLKKWHVIKYAKKSGSFINTNGMGLL